MRNIFLVITIILKTKDLITFSTSFHLINITGKSNKFFKQKLNKQQSWLNKGIGEKLDWIYILSR